MLSLQGDNLVIGLLSDFRNVLVIFVLNFGLLLGLFDGFLVPVALVPARRKLFPKHVDLPLKLLVLSLGHVQSDPFVVHGLLRGANLNFGHFLL